MDSDDKILEPGLQVLKADEHLSMSYGYLKDCLDLMKPTDDKDDMIIMGLTWKLAKLHGTIRSQALQGDNMAMAILMRVFYETALTIRYLIQSASSKNFAEFRKTDAIRKKQMVEYYRDSGQLDKSQLAVYEASVLLELQQDGIDYTKLKTNMRSGSWHRNKSYYAMAKFLGKESEEIHALLYGGTSSMVHPSWTDVKANLLVKNNETNLYSINQDTGTPLLVHLTILACQALTVASTIATLNIAPDAKLYKRIEKTHASLHKDFSVGLD